MYGNNHDAAVLFGTDPSVRARSFPCLRALSLGSLALRRYFHSTAACALHSPPVS